MSHPLNKLKEQQPYLCSTNLNNNYSSNHSTVTQGTSTTNKFNWSKPQNHPRMLGHENSSCEWVTSHLSEDMGYVVSSMGVFGDPWTTNNELKSYGETQKVTQLSRTQLHANFSEMKKKLQRHGLAPLILRTSHTSLFRTSGVTHHTQLSPSDDGHGNSTPDGCTRLQRKRNCVDIIIGHMWNRTFELAP